jgi:hypothetical protein
VGWLDTSARSTVMTVPKIGPDYCWYLQLTAFARRRDGTFQPRQRLVLPAGQIPELVALLMAAAEAMAERSLRGQRE